MVNKTISVDDSLWDDFIQKAGHRQASVKIREFMEEFTNSSSETSPLFVNATPFNFYRCSAQNCGGAGRLSGFQTENRNNRCLWCKNRSHETFVLISKAGGLMLENQETEEQGNRHEKE